MKNTNEKAVKSEKAVKVDTLGKFINMSIAKGIQPSNAIKANNEGKRKVTENNLKEGHAILEDVIKAHKFTPENIVQYCEGQEGKKDVNFEGLPLNKQRALPSLCASVKKCSTCTMKQTIKQLASLDNLMPNLLLGFSPNVLKIAYLAVYSNSKEATFDTQLQAIQAQLKTK